MNRNSLTTAVIAGIAGVAGIANMANAVNLNPDGLGRSCSTRITPSMPASQTLLSVVNTTNISKAVKVRFLEGYNSREVLDFNVPVKYDVWTADVFSLSDAGVAGDGAGIFSADNSCTAPAFTEGPLANGLGYQHFLSYAYTGAYSDGGPTTDDRTREGHFEMITMADIVPLSTLDGDITHVNSVPPGCDDAEAALEANDAWVAPTSGLFGSASVVRVDQGTYFGYNADALDGFTSIALVTPTGSLFPSLGNVNDAGLATATSYVFDDGVLLTSPYTCPTNAIDAVGSVFGGQHLQRYESVAGGSVGTDWVVTMPTKRFTSIRCSSPLSSAVRRTVRRAGSVLHDDRHQHIRS